MKSLEKDKLLYDVSKGLYDVCKRYFCSVPMAGMKCFGKKNNQKNCSGCCIDKFRALAVKGMDSTDYQRDMMMELVDVSKAKDIACSK